MAQNMFSKFEESVDMEGLLKDVAEAAANGGTGNYKEVPHGNYEVAIQQMDVVLSKSGKPMLSIWFKVVSDGEYKGCMIFYNQVIHTGRLIDMTKHFLGRIVSELDDAPIIEFKGYDQYKQLVLDIFEGVADNFEYGLKYAANSKNKDFSTYEITDVFVLE